jgi:hypothetical protein
VIFIKFIRRNIKILKVLSRLFCPLDDLAPRKHVGVFFSVPDYFLVCKKAEVGQLLLGIACTRIAGP